MGGVGPLSFTPAHCTQSSLIAVVAFWVLHESRSKWSPFLAFIVQNAYLMLTASFPSILAGLCQSSSSKRRTPPSSVTQRHIFCQRGYLYFLSRPFRSYMTFLRRCRRDVTPLRPKRRLPNVSVYNRCDGDDDEVVVNAMMMRAVKDATAEGRTDKVPFRRRLASYGSRTRGRTSTLT